MTNEKEYEKTGLKPEQLEHIVGGFGGTAMPLPTKMKAALTEQLKKWKQSGCTMEQAIYNARRLFDSIYADDIENFVRSVWDTL